MITHRRVTVLVVAAIAMAAAGCAGSSSLYGSRPQTPGGFPATVGVANVGSLGTIVVDTEGHTVYLFQRDRGTDSACTGGCEAAWPPLRVAGKPTAGAGLAPSKVGTTLRSDGTPQVTYNGHPLYLFAADKMPGDSGGQGVIDFGGVWSAVSPAGDSAVAVVSGGNGY